MTVVTVVHRVPSWIRFLFTSPSQSYHPALAPSSTMRGSQEGGSFLASISSVSPCPVTHMCGIFSNSIFFFFCQVLPSNQEQITIACIVLRISRIPMIVIQGDMFHTRYWFCLFYLATNGFWNEHDTLCMVTPINLFCMIINTKLTK